MLLLSSSDRNVIVPVAFRSCATALLLTSQNIRPSDARIISLWQKPSNENAFFPRGGSEHYELDCRFKLKNVTQFHFLLSSFNSQNFTIHCMQVFTRKLVAGYKISGDIFARGNAGAEMNCADMLVRKVWSADKERAVMYSGQPNVRKCTWRNGVCETHVTPPQASVAITAWNPSPCQEVQCSIDKKYNSSRISKTTSRRRLTTLRHTLRRTEDTPP